MTIGTKVIDEDKIPLVFITDKCMAKVLEYVKQSPQEIGWMGCVNKTEDEYGTPILTLYDAYAPPQEVSGATTDIDASGVAEYAMKVKKPEEIKWWGHSHVNMAVNPSSQDVETLLEHIETCEDYFVATIHNKHGAVHCDVYLGGGIIATNLLMSVDYAGHNVQKQVAKEIKANVRKVRNVGFNPPNRNNPKPDVVVAGSSGNGSGGYRQPPNNESRKDGNAKCNDVGLR